MTTLAGTRQQLAIRGRSNWRQGFMFFCMVMMEVLWIAPMLQVIFRSSIMQDPIPMPLENMVIIVGGNALFGLMLRRLMIKQHVELKRQQLPSLIGGILSMLVTISFLPTLLEGGGEITFDYLGQLNIGAEQTPGGLIIAPVALILYSRGSSIGRFPPSPVNVAVRGRLGIAVLFFTAWLANEELQTDIVTLLPLFFAMMLLSGALSRSSTLKITDEVRKQHFSNSWFGFLIVSTLLVTSAGILVSVLFGATDQDQMRAILEFVFTVLIGMIILMLSPFGYVLTYFLGMLDIQDEPVPEEEIIEGTRETSPSADNPQVDLSDEIGTLVTFFGDALIFGFVAIVVGLAIYFWITVFFGREILQLDDEDIEAIGDREHLNAAALAGRQLKKLGDALNSLGQFVPGRNLFAALTIRRAYGQMERIARKRGFPRNKAQTPYEYLGRLRRAFPGGDSYTNTITSAYVQVRYGELPESDEQVEDVRLALEALKGMAVPNNPQS